MRPLIFAMTLVAAATPVARQPAGPQASPAGLWAAQTGPKQITLVWARVARVILYRIYEGEGGGKLVGWTTSSGDQYVRPVAAFGVPHHFALEVVFDDGTASAKAPFNVVVPREVTPGIVTAPASVRAAAAGDGAVAIEWDAVPDATAYRITRQIAPGGFETVCRFCPTGTKYIDAAAKGGARHVYAVAAVSPAGTSRPTRSSEVVATGTAAAKPASPPPDAAPVMGTIRVTPPPGGCLSLGTQGNVLVRLADGTVRLFERVHFGRNQIFVPNPEFKPVPQIANAVAVATSGRHSLVLVADGSIRAWGRNDSGQLGNRSVPVNNFDEPFPVTGITTAVAIAAGSEHSMALLADGTIRVWGSGRHGLPGGGRDDITTNRLAPGTVAGIANATAIASGALTNFALLADGTIRAWGNNWGGLSFWGVLGAGPYRLPYSATPLPVHEITNAVAITTSGGSSLALLADGRVMAWGAANSTTRGQPEDYLTTSRPLPVPGIRTAAAVSPYLILLSDGSVRELRNPDVPVAGIAGAVAVASDPINRYALLANGRLMGWGLKQFWPKGMVQVADLGADTARECSPRRK